MVVYCYPVWPYLHLAWHNLTLDWTIFLLEPAFITSSADHTKKTKSQVNIHVSKKEAAVSTLST